MLSLKYTYIPFFFSSLGYSKTFHKSATLLSNKVYIRLLIFSRMILLGLNTVFNVNNIFILCFYEPITKVSTFCPVRRFLISRVTSVFMYIHNNIYYHPQKFATSLHVQIKIYNLEIRFIYHVNCFWTYIYVP